MPGVNDWLKKSFGDLKLARKALGDDETLAPAVYLTHQCAEKSLKTSYVFTGTPMPKTHDLGLLLNGCTRLDWEFLLLQNECRTLDPYGSNSRYPNDTFRVDQIDLVDALDMAHKIFGLVKSKVL